MMEAPPVKVQSSGAPAAHAMAAIGSGGDEANASAASAAPRPPLRAVERMPAGKSKYDLTVKSKVACRLFPDMRSARKCDALVIAPDGAEYPVRLSFQKVRSQRLGYPLQGLAPRRARMRQPDQSTIGALSSVAQQAAHSHSCQAWGLAGDANWFVDSQGWAASPSWSTFAQDVGQELAGMHVTCRWPHCGFRCCSSV